MFASDGFIVIGRLPGPNRSNEETGACEAAR